MSKKIYPVLCGGTFFSLLLGARGQRTSKRDNAGGKTDGLLQTELFIELVRIIKPAFNPPSKLPTLKKNVGRYRQCDDNGGTYFAAVFESDYDINKFDERMINEYNQVLSNMCILVTRFIGEDKIEWLVKALIEVIESDKNIADDIKFNIYEKAMTKLELLSGNEIYIPSFLLGIWHYIVMNVKDNTVGKDTFNTWHRKKGETNSIWVFNSDIGSGIKRKITILPFSNTTNDNISVESSNTAEEQTTEQDEPFMEGGDPFEEQSTADPTPTTNQIINSPAVFFNSGEKCIQINNTGTLNIDRGGKT